MHIQGLASAAFLDQENHDRAGEPFQAVLVKDIDGVHEPIRRVRVVKKRVRVEYLGDGE